jgi:2-polyprenyl-6-methoxyphenol hydroxylase-like FAD-dependent oxidoreductase
VSGLAERPLKTAVVGGGPAGLFYALLAKQRMPSHEIVVYERNPPAATFGFGVVFSEQTFGGFQRADPTLFDAMADAGVGWKDIEVRRADGQIRIGGHGFSAIARHTLLGLMQRRALAVGVRIRFQHEPTDEDLSGCDLILAADGVNSALRSRHAERFRPRFSVGAARYIWFATPQRFDALTFIHTRDEHGSWGVHAYPFSDVASTFIVETDEGALRRAGLDQADELPPGMSDMRSLQFCERLFAEHLGGQGLLENNSKWARFRTLRCESWHAGNVALVGDAAHTAHFSVGSGTKMAMEDAVALADAVGASDRISEALGRYEASRRPEVEHVQTAARPSIVWWERIRFLAGRDLEQFAFHFLTRSPTVTRERLIARDRRFVRRVERWAARTLRDGLDAGPLATALDVGALRLPSRVIATPAGAGAAALGGLALAGAGLVLASASEGIDWEAALAWVHASTPSAAGLRIGRLTPADAVQQAVRDGFDLLAAPLGAPAIEAWPRPRVLLSLIDVPKDPEGPLADAQLAELAALATMRPLIVGVVGGSGAGVEGGLMLCDRVVQELAIPCAAIDVVHDRDTAVTQILAGRFDLIYGPPSLAADRWPADSWSAAGTLAASAVRPSAAARS